VLPWAAVGEAGENRLADAGITVRCLQRPDGSLAEGDEESLVAVVGKSY
jgi:prolyl-tRNA synthetase